MQDLRWQIEILKADFVLCRWHLEVARIPRRGIGWMLWVVFAG
jgi:hypothetical protein